jgi:hypothetical protein
MSPCPLGVLREVVGLGRSPFFRSFHLLPLFFVLSSLYCSKTTTTTFKCTHPDCMHALISVLPLLRFFLPFSRFFASPLTMSTVEITSCVLQYFPIQGRGEPLRLFMEDSGIEYTESNDVGAFKEKKFDLDEYAFNQLPRLTVRPAFPSYPFDFSPFSPNLLSFLTGRRWN